MDVAYEAEPVGEPVALRFKTGVLVAALLAALIGLLVFAVVNIAADVNSGFRTSITLNSGIGPYSGKQVFLIGSWLLTWPILHFLLRNRDVNLRRWFGVFLIGLLVAVLLMWPPVFEGIANAITGG
jgi:hypothetical protein